jgi:hypothetical protein
MTRRIDRMNGLLLTRPKPVCKVRCALCDGLVPRKLTYSIRRSFYCRRHFTLGEQRIYRERTFR